MSPKHPPFREAFGQLVATPSVSCMDPALDQSNRAVIDLLANWLGERGFSVDIMPVSDGPEKVNLIATAGEGTEGLVLSGHSDTVPYNQDQWQSDPFTLTDRDERYYGLGSSDMKCFFPIILEALEGVDLDTLQQPLTVLATCNEESNMSGARALSQAGRHLGRHVVIGEPTGLKPIRMHKGVMFESIRLTGKAGHSSDPDMGINALEGMNRVINNLLAWREDLQRRRRNPEFKVPVPTLNLGRIQGGDNPNRICAECVLSVDIRLLPEMDIGETRESLRRCVREAVADETGMQVEFEAIFSGTPGMETGSDAGIVRCAEQLTGKPAGSVAFGTEGPYFNAMGMETVILGPGDIDQAHQADEYLAMNRVAPMTKIIQTMIRKYCLQGTS